MDGNRVAKESEKSEKAAMPKGIIALSQVGTPIKAATLIPNKAQTVKSLHKLVSFEMNLILTPVSLFFPFIPLILLDAQMLV